MISCPRRVVSVRHDIDSEDVCIMTWRKLDISGDITKVQRILFDCFNSSMQLSYSSWVSIELVDFLVKYVQCIAQC